MKNRILLTALITLILFMGPVFTHAQGITTVTATIVDPNGIPWAGATVQATLLPNGVTPRLPPPCNGQNASPCFVGAYLTGSVSSLGTFSMNLPDNGVLLPGGTTWQFTVSTNGAPAPLGTGPQLFTVTTAINCATNTPATCTAGAMNISATLGPVPALGFGSAGSAVSLTPSTSQTITPVNTTSVPLTIVGAASTSVDLFDVETNGLSKAIGVSNTGTTISLGAGAGGGILSLFPGGGSATIQVGAASQITLSATSGVVDLNSASVTMGQTNVHLKLNSAISDLAGKLTCAGSTVTKTFAVAYTSTPTVVVFDETTKGGANLTAISNTAFTVSCTGATDALDYIVVGNPN